jgi:hypothetical protein
MGKFLVNCIKMISGFILLFIIIIFWVTALTLTTITELITSIELRLVRIMKKCFGEEL